LLCSTIDRKCSFEQMEPKATSHSQRAVPEGQRQIHRRATQTASPETYRRVVELLAEPREHVSYREICRRCHVADDTVKAIDRREAVPIAARKKELMMQAGRIAKLAADRVEDQISDAPLPQAVVTFGVMTDKVVALSNDPQQINITLTHDPAINVYAKMEALNAAEF
jgi:hypothetical protein